MATSPSITGYRFGPFSLHVRSGELIRNGRRIRLQEKPYSLLLALMEHPGEVITRGELRERLWPDDTFVDFDDGLNTAMRKLREALGDDPQDPRYIETVRGRGYRLLAEVEAVANGRSGPEEPRVSGFTPAIEPSTPTKDKVRGAVNALERRRRSFAIGWTLATCAIAASGLGLWYWLTHARPVLSYGNGSPVLVADFSNQAGDPNYAAALRTALRVSLEQSDRVNLYSDAQAGRVLRRMERPANSSITPAVGREICRREGIPALIVPEIRRSGSGFVVTAQLVDPTTGAAVRSYAEGARDNSHLLDAVDGIAVDIRHDLGESRLAIHESHAALPEVTTPSLAALEDYADGAKSFGQGQVANAVRLYQAALAADPGFAMAHAALGYAEYSFFLNEPAQGQAEYHRALALSSRTTARERAWIELRFAESQGRVTDALRLYQAYVEKYPGDWGAGYSYARELRMNGQQQQALQIYQELARESPNDSGVWIEMATAYKMMELWPQSIQAYEKAFALDPRELSVANINQEYGFTLVDNHQDAKAEQVFEAQLRDPDHVADGERALAFLDLYQGHYASARQRLLLALAKTNGPFSVARIRYMLAEVARGQGNRREQIGQLDRITAKLNAIGPRVEYGSLVGQAYARAGETAKAKKMLAVVAPLVNGRVEGEVAYAQLLKAEVAAAEGDYDTAIDFLSPPEPDSGTSTATLMRESLGYIYQKMGKLDEAMEWEQQFVSGRGSDALGWEPQQRLVEARFALARDYQKKGDPTAARAELAELMGHWDHTDPEVALVREARQLSSQLVAAH
ncbi:MAG TPA: winged helix-turn-helix domain-containing protein [Acidobacteriaceae bacterium]|jgi:DNA-binding winged helix-turn-helix (wHTH) protein/tetratricopeptide (TPR) repeat protein|nr:winged helix-turn-helix domain-containing protein [Acidobacteriaceae bacterium]